MNNFFSISESKQIKIFWELFFNVKKCKIYSATWQCQWSISTMEVECRSIILFNSTWPSTRAMNRTVLKKVPSLASRESRISRWERGWCQPWTILRPSSLIMLPLIISKWKSAHMRPSHLKRQNNCQEWVWITILSFSLMFQSKKCHVWTHSFTAIEPILKDVKTTPFSLSVNVTLAWAYLRGARDACPPSPNSFNFMQFLGKFGKIDRMLAPLPWRVGAPISGKSWIRHWLGFLQLPEQT